MCVCDLIYYEYLIKHLGFKLSRPFRAPECLLLTYPHTSVGASINRPFRAQLQLIQSKLTTIHESRRGRLTLAPTLAWGLD